MEGFVTLDMFLSFGFCVAVVAILVQLLKAKMKKVDTWIILFVVSVLVMAINFVVRADYTWQGVLTALVNVIVVAISASGSYEAVSKVYKQIKGRTTDDE